MRYRYRLDTSEGLTLAKRDLFIPRETEDGLGEVIPRIHAGLDWRTGGAKAEEAGLRPVLDGPDLPDWADVKEIIADCHAQKLFPMYWEGTHKHGPYWNQDGLPYCWAWGAVMALMTTRAMTGRAPVLLRPVSLGWLVNWQRRGYYLSRTIAGIRERGVASAAFIPEELQHSPTPSRFKEGWEADALNYSALEWWDGYKSSPVDVIRQALAILRTGSSIEVAYNYWSHALCCQGLLWDESEPWNVVWIIRNSHRERDWLELTGNRGLPDEFFGIIVASIAQAQNTPAELSLALAI